MVLYLLGLSWYGFWPIPIISFWSKRLLEEFKLQARFIWELHRYTYSRVFVGISAICIYVIKYGVYFDTYFVLNTLCTKELVSKVENYLFDCGIILRVIFLVHAVAVKLLARIKRSIFLLMCIVIRRLTLHDFVEYKVISSFVHRKIMSLLHKVWSGYSYSPHVVCFIILYIENHTDICMSICMGYS